MTTTNSTFNSTGMSAAVVVNNSSKPITFPATEAQLELWLSSKQSVEANCAYNEITTLRFVGDLDVDALKKSLEQVIKRHGGLRATFSLDGQQMIVADHIELSWKEFDFSDLDDADQEIESLKVIQAEACTPFDLEKGPLFRTVLQKTANDVHHLTLSAHHIVMDGWSLAVICNDLGAFYDQQTGNGAANFPAVNHYKEYSQSMDEYFKSEAAEIDEKYWCDQFADTVPSLDLPINLTRPNLRSYFARRYDHVLDTALAEKLRKLGAKSGCSIFNTLLAAFECFVARVSGCDDFCIGIPTAGQMAMEQPELIGHCVNTMPLRSKVNVNDRFTDHIKKTRSNLLDCFDHQRYSFGKLLSKVNFQRDPRRAPMLAISFNIDPAIKTDEMGFNGLDVEVVIEPRMFENFEWFINGIIREDKAVDLQIQYNTDLFTNSAVKALFEGFEAFLRQLSEDGDQLISELPVTSLSQRQKVLVDWNATDREFSSTRTLHGLISEQAQRSPAKTAIEFGTTELTYRELDEQSNQWARFLQSKGVSAGQLVGLCTPRSQQMVVTLLGILKAGAGYVPLDPAFPTERLKYMCDQSKLELVVADDSVRDQVAAFGKNTLFIQEFAGQVDAQPTEQLENNVEADSTCYVIYTSGSTGNPKGVSVPHGAVANFLHSMAEEPGFNSDDKVLAVTTLSFDIAVLELYLPLITGGVSVIATKEMTTDGNRLFNALADHEITLFQSTPATLRLLINSGWTGTKSLKILCGGEPMPSDLVAPLLERCGQLWNMYGPTETTVWSSVFQIKDADAPILIGKPIANTQFYLLDKNLQPVPVGSDGEIYIGGAGVTHGYLHQDDLTVERFIENRWFNPFKDYCSNRIYKTGDLGRYKNDGNIQFLRRNDKQVKVRGFRIELGEIESKIKAIAQVSQAVAIVREDKPGDARLVGYWVDNPNSPVPVDQLREGLKESLPYYMVPQFLIPLERLPQTNNGKIDYKALPEPASLIAKPDEEPVRSMTAAEKLVASVWSGILNVDDIELNDNFFDLGGHSLLVMQSITEIESKTGARLDPPDFLIGTLEQLADKVNSQADIVDDEPLVNSEDSANVSTTIESTDSNTVQSTDISKKSNKQPGIFGVIKGFWD